jgi:hypothetical protein
VVTHDRPVRFVLSVGRWQKGYDLAIDQADNCPPADLVNPFDADDDAHFGFENGRDDAAKLKKPP